MSLPPRKLIRAWGEYGPALAQWVSAHVMASPEGYLAYPSKKESLQNAMPDFIEESLTHSVLIEHFQAKKPEALIAARSMAGNADTRCLIFTIEKTSAQPLLTPGAAFQAALHWKERLETAGFNVLLEDTDQQGTLRLWVLFDYTVEGSRVQRFAEKLVSDHTEQGLNQPPVITPNAKDGLWIRLPGMHPTQETWSRVWVTPELGQEPYWAEGSEAAQAFLDLLPVSSALMREHLPPVAVEPRGLEPNLTPDGRQWLTVNEYEKAQRVMDAIDDLSPTEHQAPITQTPQTIQVKPTTAKESTPSTPQQLQSATSTTSKSTHQLTQTTPTIHPIPSESKTSDTTISDTAISLAALAERTGLTTQAIEKRIFNWLLSQDQDTQDTLLGVIPSGMQQDVAQLVLQRLQQQKNTHQDAA